MNAFIPSLNTERLDPRINPHLAKRQETGPTNHFSSFLNIAKTEQPLPSAEKPSQAEQMHTLLNRVATDSFNALLNIGAKTTEKSAAPATFADGVSDQTIADWLNNDGPLPRFLKLVEIQKHLTPEQSAALKRIAYHFRDAERGPDTVAQIRQALETAGIDNSPVV